MAGKRFQGWRNYGKGKKKTAATRDNKYGAKPVRMNGTRYASQKEWRRAMVLKSLAEDGKITEYKEQVWFACVVNGRKVCSYVADFTYVDAEGKYWIEDTKGYRNDMYKLKKKLFEACYKEEGYIITET